MEPVVERREEEVEAEVVYATPRGQEQPPPGLRPGSLSDPGPPQQVAGTVGYVAACAPRLSPVVLVQDAVHDVKTLAWLLERTLDERQREKEEAEEEEVVQQLVGALAVAEDKLLVAMEEFRDNPSRPSWNSLSPALKAAVHWHVAVDRVRKRKRKSRRRKRRRRTTAWHAVPVRCLGVA